MTIQEKIEQDKQAIDAAQVVLDAAKAVLADDEAKLEAAQPHLSLLARIEAALDVSADAVDNTTFGIYSQVKASVQPMIDEMKALLNSI